MAETEHSQQNIAYIRTHVDKLEQMTKFAISSNPNCIKFIGDYLKSRKGADKVYLSLANGPMNLDELAKTTGLSRGSVSLICTHLFQQGLIQKVPDVTKPKSFKYAWGEMEMLLGISKIAKNVKRK